MRLFVTEDGLSGFAIKDGDELVAVFSKPGSRRGPAITAQAADVGAARGDCYAIPNKRHPGDTIGYLPRMYEEHGGFHTVAKVEINPNYNFPAGSMHVSILARIEPPAVVKWFGKEGYEDALAYRDDLLKTFQRPLRKMPPPDYHSMSTSERNWWQSRQEALGLNFHGDTPSPREIYALEDLQRLEPNTPLSSRVEWIPQNGVNTATHDFRWLERGGLLVEMKTMVAKYGSIAAEIAASVTSAANHGVQKDVFLIDIGDKTLSGKLADQLSQYNLRRPASRIKQLFVFSKADLVEIKLV
ncbi:MAG: hypothetical protein LBR21_02555 [Propionibacteriaceae bacterium]|jgi:hypothetical protein|nr:hypothetical protein [Propionibacteriaceae bacterium]